MPSITVDDARAVVIGVSGSIVAWYALQRVRVRYDWSPSVSERLAGGVDPVRYAVKVRRRQSERWLPRTVRAWRVRLGRPPREVVDVRLYVALRFKGVSPTGPGDIRNVPLPVREWLPYVRVDRVFTLRPENIDAGARQRLPERVRRVLENPDVTVRDVLEIPGYDVHLQAHLVGYDSFSGSRCVYSSPQWRLADIKLGGFDVTSLDVVPWNTAMAEEPHDFGDD